MKGPRGIYKALQTGNVAIKRLTGHAGDVDTATRYDTDQAYSLGGTLTTNLRSIRTAQHTPRTPESYSVSLSICVPSAVETKTITHCTTSGHDHPVALFGEVQVLLPVQVPRIRPVGYKSLSLCPPAIFTL